MYYNGGHTGRRPCFYTLRIKHIQIGKALHQWKNSYLIKLLADNHNDGKQNRPFSMHTNIQNYACSHRYFTLFRIINSARRTLEGNGNRRGRVYRLGTEP